MSGMFSGGSDASGKAQAASFDAPSSSTPDFSRANMVQEWFSKNQAPASSDDAFMQSLQNLKQRRQETSNLSDMIWDEIKTSPGHAQSGTGGKSSLRSAARGAVINYLASLF